MLFKIIFCIVFVLFLIVVAAFVGLFFGFGKFGQQCNFLRIGLVR